MAKITEITIWTRGVTMDKEGRDIASAIGKAAEMEGKHVMAFDNYEDLPDRVSVTTRKYVRMSDEEIEHKYVYTNDHPDVVIIAEPTIVKGINVLRVEKAIVHHILWAACRSDQTSADANIGGSWHGAFTYYFCKVMLDTKNTLSRAEVLKRVNTYLAAGHYTQIAQLEVEATMRALRLPELEAAFAH